MAINHDLQQISEAVRDIRRRSALQPEIGVILGSGLGVVAERLTDAVMIPYTEIPTFTAPPSKAMPAE